MKFFFLFFLIPLLISCDKKNQINEQLYYVEDFRQPGMDDYQTIKAAYDSAPPNSKILFANKTYIISHTLALYKPLNFYGPAILKREDQIKYTLKEPADQNSSMLVLNNTDGIINGDIVIIANGQAYANTTGQNIVNNVSGDTLFLNYPIGQTFDNVSSFPVGTNLFKNINFFGIVDPSLVPPYQGCGFINFTFDGNRDNNNGTYAYNFNAAFLAPIKATTTFRYCTFINSPTETLIGHNMDIRNCIFNNLNGSALHTSIDRQYCPESEIHTYLYNNIIENTNQISTDIGGHSEGAITHSDSGGYYTAIGNTFINVGPSLLGGLYPSVSIHDWGTNNITFTRNTINGAGRIVRFVSMQPGIIHNVKIDSNIVTNMPAFDWTPELEYFPGIILEDKSGE